MKVRHRARIVALQALYEIDSTGHAPTLVLEQRLEETHLSDAGIAFARELTGGVSSHRERLDHLIGRYATDWPVDQIATIDRNILRIAIYEILIGVETPVKVAINEAVELAKTFGSDSSSRFVNGVLGTLVAEEAVSGRQ
jgi:N utilization substance protein B